MGEATSAAMTDGLKPLTAAVVLSSLTPSRMLQVAAQVGIPVHGTDGSRAIGAIPEDQPVGPVLERLYRGELQKLCDTRGVDRNGTIYDKDLIARLLTGR